MADKRKLIPEGAMSCEGRIAWEKFAVGALLGAGTSFSLIGKVDHAATVADMLLAEWTARWTTPTDDERAAAGTQNKLAALIAEWRQGRCSAEGVTWPRGYENNYALSAVLQTCAGILEMVLRAPNYGAAPQASPPADDGSLSLYERIETLSTAWKRGDFGGTPTESATSQGFLLACADSLDAILKDFPNG